MYKNKEQKRDYQKRWLKNHPDYYKNYYKIQCRNNPHYFRDKNRKSRGYLGHPYRKPGEEGYKSPYINKFKTKEERVNYLSKITRERRKNNPYNSQTIAYERIEKEIPELENQGFRCLPITRIIPDIVAIKDGKIFAVEIEYSGKDFRIKDKNKKYDNSKYKYDGVIWIIRQKK